MLDTCLSEKLFSDFHFIKVLQTEPIFYDIFSLFPIDKRDVQNFSKFDSVKGRQGGYGSFKILLYINTERKIGLKTCQNILVQRYTIKEVNKYEQKFDDFIPSNIKKQWIFFPHFDPSSFYTLSVQIEEKPPYK